MRCENKDFSPDANSSAHRTGTLRQNSGHVLVSRPLLFTSASVLQPLPESLWHSPRKHRCAWGLTQMVLGMPEGRRWSQLADSGRVIHGSRPTFSNARGQSLMTVWAQKQSITATATISICLLKYIIKITVKSLLIKVPKYDTTALADIEYLGERTVSGEGFFINSFIFCPFYFGGRERSDFLIPQSHKRFKWKCLRYI